jgi:hypothetical protein
MHLEQRTSERMLSDASHCLEAVQARDLMQATVCRPLLGPAPTLVGFVSRKCLDAAGPSTSQSGAACISSEERRTNQTQRLKWGRPASCRSDVCQDKKTGFSRMDYGVCFAPHSATLDLRLKMYGTVFSHLVFSHLPDECGCIEYADVDPLSWRLPEAHASDTRRA